MTRASTPGSLSTRTAIVCFSMSVTGRPAPCNRPPHPWPLRGERERAQSPSRPRGEGGAQREAVGGGGGTRASPADRLHQHHALFGDGALLLLVVGAEEHLVMRRARGNHREA